MEQDEAPRVFIVNQHPFNKWALRRSDFLMDSGPDYSAAVTVRVNWGFVGGVVTSEPVLEAESMVTV